MWYILYLPHAYLLKSFQVDNSREESGRDESEDDAEDDGGDDEARVVDVVLGQDAHAQEEEDDAIAGGGQRLHRVLHRCETFLADVLERVVLRSHSKTYDADNSWPGNEKHDLNLKKVAKSKKIRMFWPVEKFSP